MNQTRDIPSRGIGSGIWRKRVNIRCVDGGFTGVATECADGGRTGDKGGV